MIIEISIPQTQHSDAVKVKTALELIASKVSADNLEFLCTLAKKDKINEKLSNTMNRVALLAKL